MPQSPAQAAFDRHVTNSSYAQAIRLLETFPSLVVSPSQHQRLCYYVPAYAQSERGRLGPTQVHYKFPPVPCCVDCASVARCCMLCGVAMRYSKPVCSPNLPSSVFRGCVQTSSDCSVDTCVCPVLYCYACVKHWHCPFSCSIIEISNCHSLPYLSWQSSAQQSQARGTTAQRGGKAKTPGRRAAYMPSNLPGAAAYRANSAQVQLLTVGV